MENDNINSGSRKPIIRHPAVGIAILFGTFLVMLLIISFGMQLVAGGSALTERVVRISAVIQDLFVFILPALLAAFFVTLRPAEFLGLMTRPRLAVVVMALVVLTTSMPALEAVVQWNANISFPEFMKPVEDFLQEMESEATDAVKSLEMTQTWVDLVMSVLIMGVLTGLSEELFFRGALQNLFFTTRLNRHACVWLTAAIFSALHMQFYGFVPRLLLGAYFGYLIWWSGSLWVPVIAHAFNNSMVVLLDYLTENTSADAEEAVTTLSENWLTVVLSVAVTAMGIVILHRLCLRRR